MSLEKRTPEGPRCGSELPKALCIFQRTVSWAPAGVASMVTVKVDAAKTPSFNRLVDMAFDMTFLPPLKGIHHREMRDVRQGALPFLCCEQRDQVGSQHHDFLLLCSSQRRAVFPLQA